MSDILRDRGWWHPGTVAKGVITILGLVLAAYLLHRTFRTYDPHEIGTALKALPPWRLALAAAFSFASYLCLTGFDALGIRYAGAKLSYPRIALTSATSLAIGHSIGFAALSSGAVRYRFYARFGLAPEQIAKVIVLCAATVGLGLASLLGVGLAVRPHIAEQIGSLRPGAVLGLAALATALPIAYLALAATARRAFSVGSWSFAMPRMPIALGQVVIGMMNFAMVAACLHAALPAGSTVAYLDVLTAYVLANSAGLLVHVPGGLGVIEAVMLYFLPGAETLGALIVFRVTYYLVPFVLGLAALVAAELAGRRTGRFRR